MPTIKSTYQTCKSTLLVLLILFSLAPCNVKESLLQQASSTVAKTLNTPKTTTTGTHCFSTNGIAIEHTVKQGQHQQARQESFRNHYIPEHFSAVVQNKEQKVVAANSNSPPKYILFKRLKIALG